MLKMIEICSCGKEGVRGGCPYYKWIERVGRDDFEYCCWGGTNKEITGQTKFIDDPDVPEWCPLPDMQESLK